VLNVLLRLRVFKDTRGQDLVEYALMAGFLALAAGAIMPNVAMSIQVIFAEVWAYLDCAAGNSNGACPGQMFM
jgi:pilus assembly protein Flp/PilA